MSGPKGRPINDAFLYAAARTRFDRFGGALDDERPDDLAASVLRAVLDKAPGVDGAGFDPTGIDEVVWGCADQAGEDNRSVGRMAVLPAGLPTASRPRPSIASAGRRLGRPSTAWAALRVRASSTRPRRRR